MSVYCTLIEFTWRLRRGGFAVRARRCGGQSVRFAVMGVDVRMAQWSDRRWSKAARA